jgi:L-ascorbate metabolism protein UlaG (beta-lactamase superfamily)
MMIHVIWTGAAGLIFEASDQTILIDPYYTRISILNTLFGPIAPDREAIEAVLPPERKISAMIVSHTHSDHVLDVPFLAAQCDGKIVGSRSLDTLMNLNGLSARTTVCEGGESVSLSKTASVTMIRSAHGLVALGKVPFTGEISSASKLPMRASAYRLGTIFAPKLQIGGRTFLHIGSANFIASELEGHTCDVLFLCVAGWKKRKGYPQEVIDITRPEAIVLLHYDDISRPHVKGARVKRLPFVDLKALVGAINAHVPATQLIVAEIGEAMHF